MEWTIKTLESELRRLRADADKAELQMLLFAWHVKHDEDKARILRDAQIAFAKFIEPFIKPSRFEAFEAGFLVIDDDACRAARIGADAVVAATRIKDAGKVAAYEHAVHAWVEVNGRYPSSEASEKKVNQVDPRAEVPQAVQRQTRLRELEIEVNKLRARVRELEAENRALRERSSAGGGKKVSKRGGARKPDANPAQV